MATASVSSTSAKAPEHGKGRGGAPKGTLLTPPQERVDPTSPSVGLRRVVGELERLTAGSEDRMLLQALVSARSADDRWAEDRPDIPEVVAEIGEVSQALLDSEMRNAEFDEIRGQLAEIARHIAVNINNVVGPGPEGDAGRRSIAAGDVLAAAGDAEGAINAYLNAGQDFANLRFSMIKFRKNIEEALSGKVNGFTWAIAENGHVDLALSHGFGPARRAKDAPQDLEFLENDQMNIASVSKNVTATAVMKLLADDPTTGLDDLIAPFLPPDWNAGTVVEPVTFRQLLTHRSRLAQNENPSDSFASLKTVVEDFDLAGDDVFVYQNINYGLFRVLIPWMWEKGRDEWEAEYLASNNKAHITAARYQQFIQEEILADLSLSDDPQCGPEEVTTLAYIFPWDGKRGKQSTDFAFCGGGGWHFSAQDLTEFVATRQFTDLVLEPGTLKQMKKNFLGYMDPANGYKFAEGAFGTYYGHGGDLGYQVDIEQKEIWFGDPPSFAYHTCMMEFPGGIHASLFMNSNAMAGVPYQCAILKSAYESAWGPS
jgi:CubicO group peptidase (beta-lactamase class C family)